MPDRVSGSLAHARRGMALPEKPWAALGRLQTSSVKPANRQRVVSPARPPAPSSGSGRGDPANAKSFCPQILAHIPLLVLLPLGGPSRPRLPAWSLLLFSQAGAEESL